MISPAQTPAKERKSLWFFVCIAILGAGLFGYIVLKALRPAPEQVDPALLVPQVQTALLAYRTTPLLIEGNGIVTPRAAISISPQVSGELVELHPSLVSGGAFRKDEVIVQIDPRSYESSLAEAEANLAASQSSLDFIDKQVARLQSLRNNDFAGEEALDDAISRRDQTRATIARLQAVIDNRRLDLERTSIRAPFDGRIYSEEVDLGDIVAPGRELARFYASDEVEVVVSLNANDSVFIPGLWNNAGPGSHDRRAWVTVNHGGRRYQWSGYVHRVESDIDRDTRTVDVVVRVPAPFTPGTPLSSHESVVPVEPPPLLVGMYATVDIEGATVENHFVLPMNALRNSNTIWVVNPEGRLEVEPVEFIRQEGDQAVLLAPELAPGTPIIISDIALVSDGMQVETVEAVGEG